MRPMQKSRNAEENEPSMKYFSDDSFERGSVRRKPAMTYVEMESISSPRKSITRSLPEAISIMPTVANRSSVWNSPAGSPSHSTQIIETSIVSDATTRKTSVNERRIGSSTIMP